MLRWMAATGKIQHVQDDGSGPRNRAQNAGFPTNWVSENIYKGSSSNPAVAWNWWLNSPIHYTGIVSPNYDQIGISSASGAHGYAFVTVFGNSTGRLPQAAASSGGGVAAPAAPPSYVLGIDEWGNIKHEIQAGQTMGDIALIYGYTWEDIPYMLELNGMTEDEIRLLQPGDVFLVPPQDGTFTPTAEAPPATATATPSATATASETRAATATAIPHAGSDTRHSGGGSSNGNFSQRRRGCWASDGGVAPVGRGDTGFKCCCWGERRWL